MPYKPIRGGTIYNQKLARAASINRQIRDIITKLVEGGTEPAKLYQLLAAITLNTVRLDDILTDLQQFDTPASVEPVETSTDE